MAAGEYVSVCSQADTENADLGREGASWPACRRSKGTELARIYESCGIEPKTTPVDDGKASSCALRKPRIGRRGLPIGRPRRTPTGDEP